MTFDVFYSTLFESCNYLKTVDTKDEAVDICLANNMKLSEEEISLGLGNFFFIENKKCFRRKKDGGK